MESASCVVDDGGSASKELIVSKSIGVESMRQVLFPFPAVPDAMGQMRGDPQALWYVYGAVDGNNSRIVRANIAEEVLALKQQPGKDIRVSGLRIASQLSDRGLIDEYRFVVHPVVAGKGPRLFETVKPQARLLLDFIGSETLHSGVVALHYRKHT